VADKKGAEESLGEINNDDNKEDGEAK